MNRLIYTIYDKWEAKIYKWEKYTDKWSLSSDNCMSYRKTTKIIMLHLL